MTLKFGGIHIHRAHKFAGFFGPLLPEREFGIPARSFCSNASVAVDVVAAVWTILPTNERRAGSQERGLITITGAEETTTTMTRAGSSRSSLRCGEKRLMVIVMVWILMLALDPSLIAAQDAPAPGSAPSSGAPAPGSAPGSAPSSGAPAPGSAPSSGAPAPGSAPGSAPSSGAPAPGSAPGSAPSSGAPAPGSAPGSAPSSGAPAPGSAPGSAPSSGAPAPTLGDASSAVPPAPETGPSSPSSPTPGPSPSSPDTNNVSRSPSGGGGLSGGAKAGIAIAVIFGVAIAGALFILRKRSQNVRRARRNSYMGGPGAML